MILLKQSVKVDFFEKKVRVKFDLYLFTPYSEYVVV